MRPPQAPKEEPPPCALKRDLRPRPIAIWPGTFAPTFLPRNWPAPSPRTKSLPLLPRWRLTAFKSLARILSPRQRPPVSSRKPPREPPRKKTQKTLAHVHFLPLHQTSAPLAASKERLRPPAPPVPGAGGSRAPLTRVFMRREPSCGLPASAIRSQRLPRAEPCRTRARASCPRSGLPTGASRERGFPHTRSETSRLAANRS